MLLGVPVCAQGPGCPLHIDFIFHIRIDMRYAPAAQYKSKFRARIIQTGHQTVRLRLHRIFVCDYSARLPFPQRMLKLELSPLNSNFGLLALFPLNNGA